MAFEVIKKGEGKFSIITLRNTHGSCEAEVFSFGALLNAFYINTGSTKLNVVDGFISPEDAEKNITYGFKSAKLSPFVCRLAEGKYSFEGAAHYTKKFFLGKEAIHGLLYDAHFRIKECGADDENAFVTFEYNYTNAEEGFPFLFSVEVTYLLNENNSLSLVTKVNNTGNVSMPLSDGWHPYFTFGKSINDALFQMNSKVMVEFNEHLIPTGNMLPDESFSTLKKIDDTFLDNCFVLDGNAQPACILRDESVGVQLKITTDVSYPYLQVYTPPHRKSVAIENLSSVPDAFNNGIGLIILKPNEEHVFITTYQLTLTS